tara:strand:- start:599 stop:2644 length:2046 start_codon:yes stop_codon:yes gene_type:complete
MSIFSNSKSYADVGIQNYHETFLSRPLDKINIPEIKNFKAAFQYNFFKKDERIRTADTNLVNIDMFESDDLIFNASTNEKPRFARLSWGKPSINNTVGLDSDSNSQFLNQQLQVAIIPAGTSVNDIISDVLVEGAMSNEIFSGFELIDTGREQKVYSMLRTTENIIDTTTPNDSRKTAAQKLHETVLKEGGLFGEGKKLIIEALASNKNQGVSYIQQELFDNFNSTALSEEDPLTKQTFSIQMNNLFMHDIIKQSSLYPDNVYQDELRGLLNISQSIKNNLLNKINTNGFNELDYDLQVPAISTEVITDINQINDYPQVLFAGYLIEKFKQNSDQTLELIGKRLVQNINQNYLIDYNVAYGDKYFYKIRTVCQVKTIVSAINLDDPACNQTLIATIYVASEGKSKGILCAENIPPAPPITLRATFDFKTLKPRITWQFPINKQRDIKRFQIFKRLSIADPFTLIGEYDFDDSLVRTPLTEIASSKNVYCMKQPSLSFIDNSHREGEKPIYTVACVDAHGLSSNYGPQIQVERDKYTNKVLRKIISSPNAPKPYPNLLINQDAFLDAIKVSRYKKIKLFFDPEYYRVTKFRTPPGATIEEIKRVFENITAEGLPIPEDDLNFLLIDPDKFTYKMQLINLDNQKDQIVKIKLADKTSPPSGTEVLQPAENISQNNISFQYGIS